MGLRKGGAAQALPKCWRLVLTGGSSHPRENSSFALVRIPPSAFISPETLKPSSSALAQPCGRWQAPQADRVHGANGDRGFLHRAAADPQPPAARVAFTFNSFSRHLEKKDLQFHCMTGFSKVPHLSE